MEKLGARVNDLESLVDRHEKFLKVGNPEVDI